VPGDAGCLVGVHHWRSRKHGPDFDLAVARCRFHGRAFTLYPPGWVPYGRLAVAPSKLDGGRSTGWDETVFPLALEVASGDPWPWSFGPDRARLSYSGEYAHLDACARLLGLHPDQALDLRHAIGEVLGLPTVLLVSLAQPARPLYLARARGVRRALEGLPVPVDWQALLVAGHLAGLWGPPLWLDRGHLVPLAFRGTRTHGPSPGDAGAPRSTTSARDPPEAPS
jgi:hypothetical protein